MSIFSFKGRAQRSEYWAVNLPIAFVLILLFSLVGCSTNRKSSNTVTPDEISSDTTDFSASVIDDLVHPAWGTSATDYKYINFGRIGFFDRSFREDTLVIPPIPGLVHRIAYAMCPTDTCFSEYVFLALRCPPIQPLLNWLSDTVYTYIQGFPIGHRLDQATGKQLDISPKYLKSDKAICNYYINKLQHVYDDWHCTGGDDHDHDVLNYQAGLLISDCWNSGDLYTFYLFEWNDLAGNGYNNRESYLTINAKTGKPLGLSDFILPDKLDSLAALMMPRLINGKKEYYIRQFNKAPNDYVGVLKRASGCALVDEGLIIYYYTYSIGFGCDGQYEAVIPYEELDGILRENLSAVLVPAPPGETTNLPIQTSEGNKTPIDLFGVTLCGSPERIIQELHSQQYIKLDLGLEGFFHKDSVQTSCRVLIDGFPFGMNLHYMKNSDIVESVSFITENPDDRIVASLRKVLTRYYGKPDIDDGLYGGYTWFLKDYSLKVRSLHTDNSGWTFYVI